MIVAGRAANNKPRQLRLARALEALGERVYRFDTDLFPTDLRLSLDEGGGGRLLRQPSIEESRRVVFGMMAALGVFQVDALEVVRRAEHKPLQLKRASGA